MKQIRYLIVAGLLCGCGRTPAEPWQPWTCSQVGQWALDRCVSGSDEPCEGVYREAVEACQGDIANGRPVCVPTYVVSRCRGYVYPDRTNARKGAEVKP